MTTTVRFPAEEIRAAISQALPPQTSAYGGAPEKQYLYVPLRHLRAISVDHPLVVGIRGAGKSVWWAALQSAEHRQLVSSLAAPGALDDVERVDAGFGEAPRADDYPDRRTIGSILSAGVDPPDIWRTVIAWHTWGRKGHLRTIGSWLDRATWVAAHPEEAARSFARYDGALASRAKKHLVLFDALDRAADTWPELTRLLQGTLKVLLEFRSYRAIRAKAFVRPDMLDDPAVTAFPDASKVIAGKADLQWNRADLFGLLFQGLANTSNGAKAFREGCAETIGARWSKVGDVWQVPKPLREDESVQRRVFHEIAGPWMGRDRRRGFPYTWLPSHLADAEEQVSPRSFLAAVRTAGEVPAPSHGWQYALHFEGIKKGVQEASRIRVNEVGEDFFWVAPVMDPLKGLVIPCEFAEIRARWAKEKALDNVGLRAGEGGRLPPKHLGLGPEGLLQDMIELRLFSRQADGRINMPDVYRVGFGLGRRGGVKPIR